MTRVPSVPLDRDRACIFEMAEPVFDSLRGARILVTGGTGFVGRWMLESLVHADTLKGLGISATVLTRDPAAFRKRAPELASCSVLRTLPGDVRSLRPVGESFSHILHLACDTVWSGDPAVLHETCVEGTRRVLDVAAGSGDCPVLFASSGAVYGEQPPHLTHLPETFFEPGMGEEQEKTYASGKREAEALCMEYAREGGGRPLIARLFAFVGPYMAFDAHFAIGNFIRDAVKGETIVVRGDGTPFRSYLHAVDLTVWMWTLLTRGVPGRPYNVGSPHSISIADLAREVSRQVPGSVPVHIRQRSVPGQPVQRYVPDVARIREELDLGVTIGLGEAISRTAAWYAGGISR